MYAVHATHKVPHRGSGNMLVGTPAQPCIFARTINGRRVVRIHIKTMALSRISYASKIIQLYAADTHMRHCVKVSCVWVCVQNRTVHTLSLSHSMVLFLPHIRMRCERIANKNSCAKIHAHTRRRQWRHAAAARAVFGRSQPTVRTGNNVLRDCNPFAGRGTIGCTVFVVVATLVKANQSAINVRWKPWKPWGMHYRFQRNR